MDIARVVQQSESMSKSLEQFVKITPEAQKVTEAECLMTNFIVEHNLPISVADHMSDLIKRMCPDSKIAKQYQCKRTKTTHIVHAMADDIISSISSDIKNGPFSILVDGSASKHKQLYPILVRYADNNIKQVVTRLLSLIDLKQNCTGENIFNILDDCVKKHTEWSKVASLSIDNENTMSGKNKGVAGYVLREPNEVFVTGCTDHLLHLAAGKAAKHLPMNIEDLLTDIFFS